MSGLELLAPLGLIAAIGVPLVVLFHMRHTTPRVLPVPTLRFWRAAIQEQPQQSRFHRPPLSLLLLLHLLIVALLALALTRPATSRALAGITQRTEPQHLILMLDGSTSMSATDTPDGRTRFEDARAEAVRRIDALREGDVATVLILGTHLTTMEATDVAGFHSLHDRLAGLPLPGGRADLNQALSLAGDLVLPKLNDQVVLLSDGDLTADPGTVLAVGAPIELMRFGGAATSNIAITDLTARAAPDNPTQQQLYIRIANFSSNEVKVPVKLEADKVALDSAEVTIKANGAADLIRNLPAGAVNVTVTAGGKDALPADNRASIALAKDDALALRILLFSDSPSALQRALTVLPGATVTTKTTGDVDTTPVTDAYDLVVYDGFTPAASDLPNLPMLIVHPPQTGLFTANGVLAQQTADRIRADDPLLNGVELAGVTFGQTPAFLMDAGETEVAGAANGPFIFRGPAPTTGQPMVVLAFDVAASNLPSRIAFPILIANVASYLAPSALPSSVPLGDPVVYRARSDAVSVRITPPDGKPVDIKLSSTAPSDPTKPATGADVLRDVAFADTGQPGQYQVLALDANGKTLAKGSFIVNAGHERESDLRANPDLPGILATAHARNQSGSLGSLSDLWPALALGALALLTLEWLITVLPRRRKVVRMSAPASGGVSHG
jgi:hypothetical protein